MKNTITLSAVLTASIEIITYGFRDLGRASRWGTNDCIVLRAVIILGAPFG